MHAGENATTAWLRKVIPLWLVVPLYAVPVLWVHAIWGFYGALEQIGPLFGDFDENGQLIPLPPLPWGQLGSALSVMAMSMGSPGDWVTGVLPAALAGTSLTALHRPGAAARSWRRNLPRLSALAGTTVWAVVAAIATLCAVFPWVASDYFTMVRERGYRTLGAAGSQQSWIAVALTLWVVVVVNGSMAWLAPANPVAAAPVESTSAHGQDGDTNPLAPDSAETAPAGTTARAVDPASASEGDLLVTGSASAIGLAGPASALGAAGPGNETPGWESPPSVGSGVFTRPGVLPGTDGVDLGEADLTAYRRPPRGGEPPGSQHPGSQQPPAQ